MKCAICTLLLLLPLVEARAAAPAAFTSFELSPSEHTLRVTRADGSAFIAPKFDTQSGFGAPAISPDGQYVGWLAPYSNITTPYAQPVTWLSSTSTIAFVDSQAPSAWSLNGASLTTPGPLSTSTHSRTGLLSQALTCGG